MGGFSADWLALREPADARARSLSLIGQAGGLLAGHSAPLVCDLGAGTGAARRAFAAAFPGDTRWCFVDNDPETLRIAAQSGETRLADLAADPAAWPADTALVTATALFDLASEGWIARFAEALARERLPLLASLTYDGRLALAPDHPDDATMIAAFNAHQRGDKGLGGPAAGPSAAATLAAALEQAGHRVLRDDTPWRLEAPRDAALMAELFGGWSQAAVETGRVAPERAARWCSARRAGTQTLTVGHADLLAVPR